MHNNKKKKYIKKEKEPIVHVSFDLEMGDISVQNRSDPADVVANSFRGEPYYIENSFSKKHLEEVKEELIISYIHRHPKITDKKLEEIISLIDKNVNLNVYEILNKYDNLHSFKGPETDKAYKYVKAMTKPIRKKANETKKEYNKRVVLERNRMLDKAGIICNFDLTGIIFSRNSPLVDKIKVLKMAIKSKSIAHIGFHNKLFENKNSSIPYDETNMPEDMREVKEKASSKYSKSISNIKNGVQTKFTAKKGLLKDLKEKVKEKDFKQKTKKALLSVGIASLALLTAIGTSKSVAQDNKLNTDFNISSNIVAEIETTKEETTTNFISQIEIDNDNKSAVENNPEMIVLQDALFEAIDVPFDTVFKSPEKGKYYSAPEGKGNYGFYDNVKENLHAVYVDVFDVDGRFFVYDSSSGLSITEIKSRHPGATLSYCVFTEPNKNTGKYKNLGWNIASENDIESCIIKSIIADLKDYLSPEVMQFLCNTDLKDIVDKNKVNKYIEQIKEAYKQKQANKTVEQQSLETEQER